MNYVGEWASVFPETEGDHYLCVHFTALAGSTLYCSLTPHQTEEEWLQLDSDGLFLAQIRDVTETLSVKAVKGNSVNIVTYDLDLTLTPNA